MISAVAVLIAAIATISSGGRPTVLVARGGDPAMGLLVNYSQGARPFDLPRHTLPTVVFIHGVNPLPKVVHFQMGQRFGESMSHRGDLAVNVLAWDWNAATVESLRSEANSEAAVSQGVRLAAALIQTGIDPSRVHLIGHSSGAMVATSAARELLARYRRPIAQLTLLDPATCYHSIIFQRLQAGSLAPIVENYWAPGPSAYGREVMLSGIRNYRVDGPARYRGVICPLRSDHLYTVHWYLKTIENPVWPGGFNSSVLVKSRI